MPSPFEAIVSYFERDSWKFRRLPGHEALEMGVAGEVANYRLVAVVDGERNVVRFLTFLEGKVPETRRREVMEYLTRANYGLLLGNFELDLADGEIRFKCATDIEHTGFAYEQYQSMLYVSVAMMDRYYPGLQKVVHGSSDAAAAITEAEQ